MINVMTKMNKLKYYKPLHEYIIGHSTLSQRMHAVLAYSFLSKFLHCFICACCGNDGLVKASRKNHTTLMNQRKGKQAKPPEKRIVRHAAVVKEYTITL